MGFKNNRRQWVKLWVNEWLQGTMRFQMTSSERGLWGDLLALAGSSRLPGIIAAGETNGKPTGYPVDYLANLLRWPQKELTASLKKFEQHERISIKNGVIVVTNWNKYQSEYQRQAKYRKPVTRQVTPKLPVEGEGEEEVEREVEHPCADGDNLFEQFRRAHPRATGSQEEQVAFMDACGGSEAEAKRIIASASIYAEAVASGELGHAPARAVNWLRSKTFNEKPELWKGGGDERDKKRQRSRENIQKALAE